MYGYVCSQFSDTRALLARPVGEHSLRRSIVRRAVRKVGKMPSMWKHAMQRVLEEQAKQKTLQEAEGLEQQPWRKSDFAPGQISLTAHTHQRMAALPPKVPTSRTSLMANKWQSAMKGTMSMRRAKPPLYEQGVIEEDKVTRVKTRIGSAGTRTITTTTSTTTSVPSGSHFIHGESLHPRSPRLALLGLGTVRANEVWPR